MSSGPVSRGRRRLSLTGRVVVLVVCLVALAAALVSTATTLAMRGVLVDTLDKEVLAAFARTYAGAARSPEVDGDGPGGAGQRIGTVTAAFSADVALGQVLASVDAGRPTFERLDEAVLAELAQVPADGVSHPVRLPGLGPHRAVAVTDGETTALLALPTGDVSATLASLIRWEALLSLASVALAGTVGAVLVRRSLSPLRDVAHTAQRVATLPLDRGEIATIERVPDRLADEADEVGQVGASLNRLLAHVEASLQARHHSEQQVRQFVADASHELRTPLATIAGYTELAAQQRDLTEESLTKVRAETTRMADLVDDLLLLARLDQGRPLVREPVELPLLLVEVVNDARILAEDHTWRLNLGAGPSEVLGDPTRLRQVVTNLVTNARTHTPPGTTVTVTRHPDGFSVHDDGPGIPSEMQASIFDRFTRVEASRGRGSGGGTGLGLALVKAIVASHGGEVQLSSRPGSTEFRVRLTLDA